MSRRIIYTEKFYHIYNRGNHRQAISWDEEDKDYYLNCIKTQLMKKSQELIAYCIMDNHYHLAVKINSVDDFIKAMTCFGIRSSRYYNKKYRTSGHLFQGRYRDRELEGIADLIGLSRYIHLNPKDLPYIDEKNQDHFINYRWSSLGRYLDTTAEKPDTIRYVTDNFENTGAYFKYLFSSSIKEDLMAVQNKDFHDEILQRAYGTFQYPF